jgi:NAD(P)-dependent dehydrogenase (short-subunit alcohol dehydrogenase family)
VGKLDGKVAVITCGSSGMALAGPKLFVEEGAHVFISGNGGFNVEARVALGGESPAANHGC